MNAISTDKSFNNIPPELQEYPNWVCGDLDKVPFDPKTGKKAMADVSRTWGTFSQATKYLEAHKNNGIRTLGFEMGESPFTGVDFDHCRSPETRVVESWVMESIKALDSYTEVSPSGTGIRIFVTAGDNFPLVNRKKGGLGESGKGAIEIANNGKYFSVTGNHLEGTPTWICYRPEELKKIFDQYFPEKPPAIVPTTKAVVTLADEEIIKKAIHAENGEKVKQLWEGDYSAYPSQSEAELALCCHLAFWTGKDPAQMDRLFHQSGLFRDKWNREDYRTQTIAKAIATTKEVYARPVNSEDNNTLLFPDIITGVAGEFAELYSTYLEAPAHFFFISFLTCLGSVLSNKLTLQSEIKPQPRLYVVLLGESGDVRKSTAISKTLSFFQDHIIEYPVSWGVSSAEGLQARLKEQEEKDQKRDAVLLLVYDEFKSFVSKCKIDGSVLLPMCTTLFESNRYESRTKSTDIKLQQAYLSMLAASTINTYERVFDSNFGDIGMINRLFICPGDSERRFSFPEIIPDSEKKRIGESLTDVLHFVGQQKSFELTTDAKNYYHKWYLSLENSIHTKRLDVYALRFMTLLAVNELKDHIDLEIVDKVTRLMDWQLVVRKQLDPIDTDNKMAGVEEKIRRALKNGAKNDRDLKRAIHASRVGIWFYDTAIKNLSNTDEIMLKKESKQWVLK